jgi:hypothetical protein
LLERSGPARVFAERDARCRVAQGAYGAHACPRTRERLCSAPAAERISTVRDPRNILIALLVIAVGVLGYLYYDSQQHRISVNLPGFKLDAK